MTPVRNASSNPSVSWVRGQTGQGTVPRSFWTGFFSIFGRHAPSRSTPMWRVPGDSLPRKHPWARHWSWLLLRWSKDLAQGQETQALTFRMSVNSLKDTFYIWMSMATSNWRLASKQPQQEGLSSYTSGSLWHIYLIYRVTPGQLT